MAVIITGRVNGGRQKLITILSYEDIGIPLYVPEAEANKRIRQKVMALPWKKAIIVYIEPEED